MTESTLTLYPDGCVQLPDYAPPADAGPPVPVPEHLRAIPGDAVTLSLTLYDTWPWDLWNSGRLLVGDGSFLRVLDRKDGATRLSEAGSVPAPLTWDQPAPLAAETAGPAGLRAVVPQARLQVEQRWWSIRNEDDKIVARLLDQTWGDDTRTVQVVPLRGYDEEAREVGLGVDPTWFRAVPPLQLALDAHAQPRRWTSKPQFDFAPATPARDAAVEMLRTLLALARQTEEGIVADLDTEFLHDYRVLIRRARSVLSVMRGVFSPHAVSDLKDRFRELGQHTNRLRDLDVHLLERREHEARVPPGMRPGLAVLFDDLQLQRDREQKEVARTLRSAPYRRRIEALDAAIGKAAPGRRAKQRLGKMADQRLHDAFVKVVGSGRRITPTTPDEAVHDLRIRCKKLRYTLEFFRGLYDTDSIDRLVRSLKGLQDVLGAFNDLAVQQEALREWVAEGPRVPRETVLAIGALLGSLYDAQTRTRAQAETAISTFDEPKVAARVEALTGQAVEVAP